MQRNCSTPQRGDVRRRRSEAFSEASPKSAIFTLFSWRRMFSGLRSRWMMPWSCRYASPFSSYASPHNSIRTCRKKSTRTESGAEPSFSTSRNDPSLQYSIWMNSEMARGAAAEASCGTSASAWPESLHVRR